MDTSMIKDPNKNPNKEANLNLDHPSINSHSPTFLLHRGLSSSQISHIKMTTKHSVSYTSLKDLLPTPLPPGISSPTHNNSSWHEVSMKNPFAKHAALDYLQPMSSPPHIVEAGSFGRLKEICCDGCLFWLYEVVWRNIKEAVWESREEVYDDYYEDD